MKLYQKLRKNVLLVRAFWLCILLVVWELGVKVTNVSPMLFPSVGDVVLTLWLSLTTGDLLLQTGLSLGIIFLGLVIGTVLAMLLALLSVQFGVVSDMVETLSAIAHPLPGIAILPLIIMWFGTGTGAIVAIIVHSCLWCILLNLLTGFRSTPQIYLDVAHNLSMKPWEITTQILVPASFSYLLSGVKIGWARAWRALISAEMVFGAVGSVGGIGWYIFKQRTFMNTSGLFAGIVVVIVIGMLIEDVLFVNVEKMTVTRWGSQCRQEV